MSHVVYGTSVKDVASKERLEKAFSVQLQEKKPVFYVLPSHKWLQTARKKQPGLLVTTFDDIASFILKQADETYLPLSEHERSLFFQQFMREEGFIKEGEHFGKAQGYADTYGQVKRLGLEVTELPPALDPLTSLFTNYEEKIVSARQLLDPENMILRAIALLEQAPASINIALVVIDGYFDFSPLQAMLIEALKHATVPVELYVPNDESFSIVEETVAELGAIGFTDARERSHKQKLVGQKEIIAATTDEEQWRGVMEDICLSKLPLERIGVLVVDESMNALERYSSMYGLPLNHVRKRPLSTTAIYAFLLALLKLRQMPSSRWEQLPLVEHVLKLYFVRGLAYAKQKHSFLQASTWNRGEWERLFDYACSLIWERPKRLVTYLEQLRNWLVNLPVVPYWEQQFELETDVRLRQEMADEYKAWQELISQLERYKELLNEKGLSELTMSHDLFIEWVKERGDRLHLFKERASKGGLGVFTWRDVGLFSGEKLYIIGMNEGVYPTPAHLSGYVQERDVRESSIRFSPPTQVRARLKQEAHFRQLDYVAKSITFTYVKGTDPNHPLLSSPFLVDLNIRERTWSTDQRMTQSYAFYKRDVEEKMAYHLGNGDVIEPMPKELQTMSARLKRLETGEELLALRQEMQKPVVSVTALESYARCPFRYAMDHVLDVEKLKAEEEQVSPLELGEIIHRIIEEVYVEHGLVGIAFSKVCKEKLDRVPEWIARRFEEKWTELEKASGEMSRLDLLLAKREWEKRLEYWWKAERQHFWDNEALADMAIMALEKPVRLKVSLKQGSELILTGKVDRVDVSDAAFVIYDYKTGRAHARLEDVRSGLKLQLPLYTLALSQEMGKKEARTAEGATYISLLEPKKRAGNGIWLPDQIGKGSKYGVNRNVGQGEETLGTDEFMTKYELNERIEELWTGMKENFSVKPLECSAYCQYRAVCRVTEEKIEGSKWGKGDE